MWNSQEAGVVARGAQTCGESQTAEVRPQRASQAHWATQRGVAWCDKALKTWLWLLCWEETMVEQGCKQGDHSRDHGREDRWEMPVAGPMSNGGFKRRVGSRYILKVKWKVERNKTVQCLCPEQMERGNWHSLKQRELGRQRQLTEFVRSRAVRGDQEFRAGHIFAISMESKRGQKIGNYMPDFGVYRWGMHRKEIISSYHSSEYLLNNRHWTSVNNRDREY